MNTYKKTARTVGVLFITATVAGVLSMVYSAPINGPDFLVEMSENGNQVILAAVFSLIMGLAVAGIAIAAYPVLKKQNETLALGYVGARILEGVIIIATVLSWLLLLVFSREVVQAGAVGATYSQTIGETLRSVGGWAGHVILDIAIAPVHYLIFYTLLYRAQLVSRWLSVWGLIGIPLWFAAGVLATLGHDPTSTLAVVLNLPIALNEMVLALWLIVKGFDAAAIPAESAQQMQPKFG